MEISSFISKIKLSNGIVVYFKNELCPPCKVLRSKVEQLISIHFPKMDFVLVDTAEEPLLSNEFRVFSNPTILVFFEGKEYIRKSKNVSIIQLETEIKRLYQMVY